MEEDAISSHFGKHWSSDSSILDGARVKRSLAASSPTSLELLDNSFEGRTGLYMDDRDTFKFEIFVRHRSGIS
jgi:hypothetical protein